jgi:hypothetical protein
MSRSRLPLLQEYFRLCVFCAVQRHESTSIHSSDEYDFFGHDRSRCIPNEQQRKSRMSTASGKRHQSFRQSINPLSPCDGGPLAIWGGVRMNLAIDGASGPSFRLWYRKMETMVTALEFLWWIVTTRQVRVWQGPIRSVIIMTQKTALTDTGDDIRKVSIEESSRRDSNLSSDTASLHGRSIPRALTASRVDNRQLLMCGHQDNATSEHATQPAVAIFEIAIDLLQHIPALVDVLAGDHVPFSVLGSPLDVQWLGDSA